MPHTNAFSSCQFIILACVYIIMFLANGVIKCTHIIISCAYDGYRGYLEPYKFNGFPSIISLFYPVHISLSWVQTV